LEGSIRSADDGSDTFYEGNSWTYSTFVPQDVAGLIAASGGNEIFVKRMNAFFDLLKRYDVGNEPGFLAPYLYIWAGHPEETQRHIRSILAKSYHSGTKGLPGMIIRVRCRAGIRLGR
jgi:putative alpha-1,2-mannosidase